MTSREISSSVFSRRASRKTCWPSTTLMPAAASAASTGSSATSTPTGSPARPYLSSSRLMAFAHFLGDVRLREGKPRAGSRCPGASRARRGSPAVPRRAAQAPEPWSSQGLYSDVVAGRRAEVPDDRLSAARQQGEADELVHRPGPDMGGGHVADVVEVEAQQRAEVARFELAAQPRQAFSAEPVEVDALLPVDRGEPEALEGTGRASCSSQPPSMNRSAPFMPPHSRRKRVADTHSAIVTRRPSGVRSMTASSGLPSQ